jgi:hypothetical protein
MSSHRHILDLSVFFGSYHRPRFFAAQILTLLVRLFLRLICGCFCSLEFASVSCSDSMACSFCCHPARCSASSAMPDLSCACYFLIFLIAELFCSSALRLSWSVLAELQSFEGIILSPVSKRLKVPSRSSFLIPALWHHRFDFAARICRYIASRLSFVGAPDSSPRFGLLQAEYFFFLLLHFGCLR